eukprot:524029-Rhodomonas_salina.1
MMRSILHHIYGNGNTNGLAAVYAVCKLMGKSDPEVADVVVLMGAALDHMWGREERGELLVVAGQ